MKQAKEPFQFVAASYLTRIRPERAYTLGDMGRDLRRVSQASIFYHTFQSLESHHYTVFSSDFAQWVMAACNEAALAERLAAVDLRDFVSLEDLRDALASRVEEHLEAFPQSADRSAFEPFHFCEALDVSLPAETKAHNLAELGEGIRHLGLQTLHHHFINSRLRLHLRTNDFSNWIDHNLGYHDLAERLNRIDFYTISLEGLREQVIETLQPWMHR